MSSPFGQELGSVGIDPIGVIHNVSQVRLMQERAIAAYRRNIALPDVYIADRQAEQQPIRQVGEDGQELTPERRAQLMAEAGVKPAFDEQGESTGQDYTQAFDQVVQPERFGQAAENNRPPIRVVQPRELEDLMALDLDDSTVASAEGPVHIPGTEVAMAGAGSRCVFTSGCQNHGDQEIMRKLVSDAIHRMTSAAGEIALIRLSWPALQVLHRVMPFAQQSEHTFLGIPVQLRPELGQEIRFLADPQGPHAGKYATVFVCNQLMERVAGSTVDPQADTAELESVDDEGDSDD